MAIKDGARARQQKLEQAYAASPGRYRLRLLLWAGLGHLLLVGGLLLCVAVLLAMAWQMTRTGSGWEAAIPAMVLGATAVVLARGLWLRFEPPAGYRLEPGEAPALQAEVERIRRAIGAEPLDGIYLNAELNAAAAYVPRMAGLAGARHYLVLGLPLLQLLDRDELAAVIAHEFGHFHGGDGRFSGWVYRARIGWRRVAHDLATRPFAAQALMLLFLRWYLPRLDEISLVVARQQEFAADAVAARVAGASAAATSLARLNVASEWLERRFWPDIERAAQAQSYPALRVHEQLCGHLQARRASVHGVPARLLQRQPDACDTHPTLARRLAALAVGEDVRLMAGAQSAADALLEAGFHERLQAHFSTVWQEGIRQEWAERHRGWKTGRARLDALAALSTRTAGETFEYARLLEDHRPDADVAALYVQVLDALPAHPAATGWLGLCWLRAGRHAEGTAALRRALELDPAGARTLLDALQDLQAARPLDAELQAAGDALQAAHAPVQSDEDDALVAHALDAVQLAALVTVLASEARIGSAWLVSRRARDPLAPPQHLLLVHWKGSVVSEAVAIPRLAARLEGPGTFQLLGTAADRALARRIRATAGAPIHRRP